MPVGRITKRSIDALQPGPRDTFLWDTKLKGFGVKVTPAGKKIYVVQYRTDGGRAGKVARIKIGDHGRLTPHQAERKAANALAAIHGGKDPAAERRERRKENTVSEVADRYLREHVVVNNKPTTAAEVKRVVNTKIKPELGDIRITDLTRAKCKSFHQSMWKTPYEANRCLAYLSKMLSLAAHDWELRPDNPTLGLKRFRESARQRYLTDDELSRLGKALNAAAENSSEIPGCLTAIKLLALTGMRMTEALTLQWSDVDLGAGTATLADAKAGPRLVGLGRPAIALLTGLSSDESPYVVHGPDPQKPLSRHTLYGAWCRLRDAAELENARPHDLRHTSGTFAAQAGFNSFAVRDMLGHKTMAMTSRYVKRATDQMRHTADVVSGRVEAALSAGDNEKVVPLKKQPVG